MPDTKRMELGRITDLLSLSSIAKFPERLFPDNSLRFQSYFIISGQTVGGSTRWHRTKDAAKEEAAENSIPLVEYRYRFSLFLRRHYLPRPLKVRGNVSPPYPYPSRYSWNLINSSTGGGSVIGDAFDQCQADAMEHAARLAIAFLQENNYITWSRHSL